MQTRTWVAVGAIALAAVAATVWVGMSGSEGDEEASSVEGQAGALAVPTDPTEMTPDQVRARLFEQGAISGTEPAGEWCVREDRLTPCPELRRRFDFYIATVGDDAPADIRKLTADEARKAHGDKLGAEIMALWDKYWQLHSHTWRNKLEPGDLRTWVPALEEQKEMRQRLLGEPWAQAFYAEEDRKFKAYFEQMQSGQPSASPPASAPSATGK